MKDRNAFWHCPMHGLSGPARCCERAGETGVATNAIPLDVSQADSNVTDAEARFYGRWLANSEAWDGPNEWEQVAREILTHFLKGRTRSGLRQESATSTDTENSNQQEK